MVGKLGFERCLDVKFVMGLYYGVSLQDGKCPDGVLSYIMRMFSSAMFVSGLHYAIAQL